MRQTPGRPFQIKIDAGCRRQEKDSEALLEPFESPSNRFYSPAFASISQAPSHRNGMCQMPVQPCGQSAAARIAVNSWRGVGDREPERHGEVPASHQIERRD